MLGAGAGAHAVSWLRAWWRQGAGVGCWVSGGGSARGGDWALVLIAGAVRWLCGKGADRTWRALAEPADLWPPHTSKIRGRIPFPAVPRTPMANVTMLSCLKPIDDKIVLLSTENCRDPRPRRTAGIRGEPASTSTATSCFATPDVLSAHRLAPLRAPQNIVQTPGVLSDKPQAFCLNTASRTTSTQPQTSKSAKLVKRTKLASTYGG